MKSLLRALKKKSVFIPGGIIIIILLVVLLSGGSAPFESIVVEKGDVISEVSVTGTVTPSQNLNMAFERSGRINTIFVEVGDVVTKGTALVSLDNDDLYAQRAQAQAQYDSAFAKLQDLLNGSQEEDIAVYQSRVETAQNALKNAQEKAELDLHTDYISALDTIRSAHAKAEDAVRNKTNDMFTNDESITPQLTFTSSDSSAAIDAGSGRREASYILDSWLSEIEMSSAENTDQIDALLERSQNNLTSILSFYNNLERALNGAHGLTETTYTTYKTYLSTGRTNIVAALSAITTQQQSIDAQKSTNQSTIDTAQNALRQAETELALRQTQAGGINLSLQKAQVDQAYASVSYYTAQIEKTILRAPFEGTITKVAYEEGEIVSPNAVVISIIGSGTYQIEAYVTESDIARVNIGSPATVTLDAYGKNEIFQATVSHIDLSETIIDGVATYKTILSFNDVDERIKSGLTANIDILHDKREDVLFVPTRSVFSENGKQFVKKIEGEETIDWEVTTGLRGSDGRTEIIEGLSEGDRIAT